MPMISGSANWRMESTPSTYSVTMVSSVVIVVFSVRGRDSVTDLFTISSRGRERTPALWEFSRMRSKMMIVLLIE